MYTKYVCARTKGRRIKLQHLSVRSLWMTPLQKIHYMSGKKGRVRKGLNTSKCFCAISCCLYHPMFHSHQFTTAD